jgi:hypothetical protein
MCNNVNDILRENPILNATTVGVYLCETRFSEGGMDFMA